MKKLFYFIMLLCVYNGFSQIVSSTNVGNLSLTSAQVRFFVSMQGQTARATLRYIAAPGNPATDPARISLIYNNSVPISSSQNPSTALVFNVVNLTAGTTYNYVIDLLNMDTGNYTNSTPASFTTTAVLAPTVSAISTSAIGSTGATIDYTITTNGANATTVVKYGTSSSNLNLTSASKTTNYTVADLPKASYQGLTGLTPSTTYFYSVSSTNSTGVTNSTPVQSFTTVASQLVYHFPFNGDMNSVVNSATLTSTNPVSYVSNGTTINNALTVAVDNTDASRLAAPTASLNLLPTGTTPRSIAVRVKFNTLNADLDFIYSWGTNANGQACMLQQNSTKSSVSGWGSVALGHSADYTNAVNTSGWNTYVVTFDGVRTRLYFNNTMFTYINVDWNTLGQNFFLGRSPTSTFGKGSFAIDDLKIYNYELSIDEIATLTSSQKPTIANVSNTFITTSRFTVNFSVNANNNSGNTTLRWGTSANNLSNTMAGNPISGNIASFQAIAMPNSLTQGTTYYYAIDAENSWGKTTVTGSATTALPVTAPTIGTINISNVSTTGATIAYEVQPNNGATDAYVLYGTSAATMNSNLNYNSGIATNTTLTENFTGLLPATQYFYKVVVTNGAGTNMSIPATFTTLTQTPIIGNPTIVTSINRADISFPLTTNAATASYVLNYGTNPANLNLTATGNANVASSTILVRLNGLNENTTYYFNIVATNVGGSTSVPTTGNSSFLTLTKTLLYHFPFNGSLTSADNSVSLDANMPVSYVSNGGSNTNEAALLNMSVTKNLPNLPQGNRARTITLRLKFNDFVEKQHLFNYGSNVAGQKFLLAQNTTTTFHEFFGSGFDTSYANAANTTDWYNYAVTFDMNEVKIYRDGNLLNPTQTLRTLNTIGTLFRMRISDIQFENYLNINADDLRIYNYALTQAEIVALNTSLNPASLSNEEFAKNLKVSIYPNPINSTLNIDLTSEIKQADIFDLQGKKLLSTSKKQFSVSDLAKGVYLIKVQDEKGGIATQKFIKK